MTSAARLVLSSTKLSTKNEGMTMKSANPQTTISFKPMDRDLIVNGRLNDNPATSFISIPPLRKVLYTAKHIHKKTLYSRWHHPAYQPQSRLVFADFGGIANDLLERRQIFDIASTPGRGNSADGERTIALVSFDDFDHLSFFQHAQVAAQIAVGKRAQLFEIVKSQALRIRNQGREYAEAGALVDHSIQPLVSKTPFARRGLRFHRGLSVRSRGESRQPIVGLLQTEHPWPRERTRGCLPGRCRSVRL